MTTDEMQNNPAFQNLSPEKLEFLMNFMSEEKTGSAREMMRMLTAFSGKARDRGIRFSEQETDFVIDHLMESMPPAEKQRAKMILRMLKRR
ncbi:MAG: hypothetical protein LUD14_07630 [Clostridiales bacterium]|nr:hypothetical protein [Clostridiales bacterium]